MVLKYFLFYGNISLWLYLFFVVSEWKLLSHVWIFVTHNCSPPSSSIHGISQASILEWIAIPFYRGGIFQTQILNLALSHCRRIIYHLCHQGRTIFCYINTSPKFSSVQLLNRIWLFGTPWTATHQASLSITNSQSLLKLMSIELVMWSNHLILYSPLLLLPLIFHSIRVFSNESVLCIRWPNYWSFTSA